MKVIKFYKATLVLKPYAIYLSSTVYSLVRRLATVEPAGAPGD